MYWSKYNVVIPHGDKYALINPLAGSFDIADKDEIQALRDGIADMDLMDYAVSRGYIYDDEQQEKAALDAAYGEFQDIMATSQTQVLLIPTYDCNFSCIYCYESGVAGRSGIISREAVDAFFDDMEHRLGDEAVRPYITLFGGEPLLNRPGQKDIIAYIIDKAADNAYEIAVVTNGYYLADYLDILSRAHIREIQVTLDGPPEVHNRRRRLKGGQDSFDTIMEGIAAAIDKGMPINLRVVTDKDNINDLPRLADILEHRGWLDLPPERFKVQIGRNYDPFNCFGNNDSLMDRAQLWADYTELSHQYPILKKFHQPEFKGLKQAIETGSMYAPTFDTCPAGKKEWVYDLYGDIYGCTAASGREEYKLGTYFPESKIFEDRLEPWRRRDILHIEQCASCPVGMVCGGGCGVMAHQRSGEVLAPDCEPIADIWESALKYYDI